MERIEDYLQLATSEGGFQMFNEDELAELQQLSMLAEQYEDTVLHIMPIIVRKA
ncbi:hypothetical protein [Dyadobacter sp. Leaf189]|uniref:hypothetical protein n=1 Tax=Dyadobacter sp. Leaf189 TaxID=1736295 RepID=UPI0012FB7179|nr:hypothetical protein [Dyadobacter sp. Leaf189]